MAEKRPIMEIEVPEFIKLFGEVVSCKSNVINNLMPSLNEILKTVPDAIRQGIEDWQKS